MNRSAIVLSLLACAAVLLAAQPRSTKPLDIYIVDPEGGKAALFVSPSGQTLLIDSGNAPNAAGARDTDRIMAAITAAGVTRIDYLISTHYHGDHVGGMLELAKRIPIAHFLDHGPSVEPREQVPGFQAAYAELYGKAQHTVVKPGDKVPITGIDWRILTSAGAAIKTPLPGGGKPNPECATFQPKDVTGDPENGQSVGSLITYGQFRAVDLGDLLWNREFELMCPNNPIGTVDLYLVSHHGLDISGSPVLVHGLQPRVAVMQNSTGKGATIQAMQTMRSSPGLEDIWQLHWGNAAGLEQNSAGVFIANVSDPATTAAVMTAPPGGARGGTAAHVPAYWIKISAEADGTFTVTNSRNNFSKTYAHRKS